MRPVVEELDPPDDDVLLLKDHEGVWWFITDLVGGRDHGPYGSKEAARLAALAYIQQRDSK